MAARSPCPVLPDRLRPFYWITIAFLISHGYCLSMTGTHARCKQSFSGITFNRSHHIPDYPFPVDAGQLCSSGGVTCCTKNMESQLVELSAKDYQTLLHKAIEPLRSLFTSRTNKFDEFFKALLNNSYNDLHTMFVKTYGLLYQQNAVIFSKLYGTLNSYYRGHNVDLKDALMSFFESLLKKMYQLINSQYQMSERYLECVGSQMKNLAPFSDIPKKLSHRVKQSFIVARTFVQGLSIGRDIIINISKIEPSKRCSRSLAQMMYCQHCSRLPHKKPCTEYCTKTIQACQPYNKEFNDVWNSYIHALEKIAEQLDGPFNIESVIDPINVKISDAIMTFQSRAASVTEYASTKCGHLSVRVRRQADEMKYEKFDYEWPSKKNLKRPITAAGTSLDRLMRDIKDKVKIAKDFWINVPYFICKDAKLSSGSVPDSRYKVTLGNLSSVTAMTPDDEDDCWSTNGKNSDWSVMLKNDTDDTDPEIKKMKSVIEYQVAQLRSMTLKLEDAYNGENVESLINDVYGSGDSSGNDDLSGSGSGDHDDDDITYKEIGADHQSNTDGYYFASTTPRTKSFRPAPNDRSAAGGHLRRWSVAGFTIVFTSQLILYTCLLF